MTFILIDMYNHHPILLSLFVFFSIACIANIGRTTIINNVEAKDDK